MNEALQQSNGALRSAMQTLAAYIILQITPILDALQVDTAAAEALVLAAVMGLYWLIMNAVQNSPFVQNQPWLAGIIALLMGGGVPPSYIEVEGIDDAPSPRPLP